MTPPPDIEITTNSNPASSPDNIQPTQASIFSEIQSVLDNDIRSLINREKIEMSLRLDSVETEQKALRIEQSECRTKVDCTIQMLEKLEKDSEVTSSRIGSLEARVDLIDVNLKSYVDSHMRKVNKRINDSTISQDKEELRVLISKNVREVLNSSAPAIEVKELAKEIETIKHQSQCDNMLIENMRTVISEVKDQLDKSLDRSAASLPSSIPLGAVDNRRKDRERDLTRNAIEGSARLIRQLTLVKINEFSEVGLIRKCNQDVRKITGYIKNCQELLMKYLSYEGIDGDYYQSIETLLDNANDWIIGVERVYALSEVHSIANSKGNVSMVRVFSDNADKTIYEFMELLEINLIGWGSNKQRANTLFNDHLSENIKSKTITIADNFAALKQWLFKEYGSPSRIIGEIIFGLKGKTMPGDDKQKYSYFARLSLGLARLDKLSRVPQIDITELDNLLYHRMTLESLFELLPGDDLKKFKRLMSQNGLDWKNPTGIRAFILLKQFCDNERDILEPYKSIDSGIVKSRTPAAHVTIQTRVFIPHRNPPPAAGTLRI